MWGRGRPYTWSMAGSRVGSATLKSLEEERGRHIKALASEDSFLLILPLLLAWGPLAWGLSPLPGSGRWRNMLTGLPGQAELVHTPALAFRAVWLQAHGSPSLDLAWKRGLEKPPQRTVASAGWRGRCQGCVPCGRPPTGPLSASPLQGRVPPLQQSLQACLLSPQRVTLRTP